ISGMSFGATIGVSTTDLRGHAYHMRNPSDIEGAYSAIGAGGPSAGGAAGIRLRNTNGVILELSGTRAGIDLSLAVIGVPAALRRHHCSRRQRTIRKKFFLLARI